MEKRVKTGFFILTIASLSFIAIVKFLTLPVNIQELASIGIYGIAALAGITIGSLIAKIYTLRKRLQKENFDLERKQDNIQSYLTNVVHDLRSPAASINMISELLEEDLICPDPKHKELLSSIHSTSKTMLDRICCILDNAAAEQYGTLDKMVFGNPYKIIQNVINKHHILAIDKDIAINLELPKNLPSVFFEEEALESVFSNLVSNAIKYSMPKTTVSISFTEHQKQLTFAIKDEGLGMTKEDLSMVFGRFAKLSARPTANEDSSGIGLSIVKNLVEKMNGSVKAYSEGKDQGCTFFVTLSQILNTKQLTA